ncbi:hypothetical protein WKI65_02555 [Streptomyces sp. MS1.AVA.3]|uniref:hypothetical protein n=1 Tax=Streptomyces decoyicus TaxID=249567 RepID=UPI0030C5D05D
MPDPKHPEGGARHFPVSPVNINAPPTAFAAAGGRTPASNSQVSTNEVPAV